MDLRIASMTLAAAFLAAACTRPVQPAASPPADPNTPPTWAQITEAARRESQVVVWSQSGTPLTDAMVTAFQQANPGISVDYTGLSGAQMVTKLTTERAAGLYGVDLIVHGTTSMINGLLPAGALDPIRPALVGPDVADESVWRGGALDFADEAGQHAVLFLGGMKIPFIYNPNLLAASEITSYQDLLDPKWKGKIVMLDPRVAGAGLATATFMYTTPGLGREYMQRLFTQQEVVLTKEDRQLTDWVARGQYLIGLASNDFTALDLKARGVPLESFPAENLREGSYLTAAWGSVGLMAEVRRQLARGPLRP